MADLHTRPSGRPAASLQRERFVLWFTSETLPRFSFKEGKEATRSAVTGVVKIVMMGHENTIRSEEVTPQAASICCCAALLQ